MSWRLWRLPIAIAAAALSVTVALAGLSWHYSDLVLGLDRPPTLREQRVLAVGSGRIRLSRDHESLQPGVWALQWQDGYGSVGRVLATDSRGVEREFRAVVGEPPVGGWASLRGVSRSADPQSMLGLAFETVTLAGPLGNYPAWYVPGRESTWVLYVHGRGANRAEALRTLGVVAARGLPGLLVTYRNDQGAPSSPDGLCHLGLTEWEDLEAAARHAIAHGARDLVLSGYSMGGQVVIQFMVHSPLAPRVSGVLLESPVLDWTATLEHRARVLGVPGFLVWLGKTVAAARAGLDWDQLDVAAHARGAVAPILVFHSLHDTFAPESVSEAFARALPRQITLVRLERGDHVEAWNADPVRYAATLNQWLTAHGIARNPG